MMELRYRWENIVPVSSPAGESPCPRSSHSISSIGNKIYCLGGELTARVPLDFDLYELDLGGNGEGDKTWQIVQPINRDAAPPSRLAHSQAVIGECIWIFGGRQGVEIGEKPLNDLFYFDTSSKRWVGPIVSTSSLVDGNSNSGAPPPRSFHKMCSVGHMLYVFGGCGTEGRLNDLHAFDTRANTWAQLPSFGAIDGRGGPSFGAGGPGNNTLIVTTGYSGQENNDIFTYNITTQEWEQQLRSNLGEGSLFRARSVCPHCPVMKKDDANQYMLVFGGEVSTSDRGHEGAGGFASDLVCIDMNSNHGAAAGDASVSVAVIPTVNEGVDCPAPRGWTEMTSLLCSSSAAGETSCEVILFGGLTGNDEQPIRLNDVWRLTARIVSTSANATA